MGVAELLLDSCSPSIQTLNWTFVSRECSLQGLTYRLISCSALPHILSQPFAWKQLHTLAVKERLSRRSSMERITQFLTNFHPQSLNDVTVRFDVVDPGFVNGVHEKELPYSDACLKLDAALARYHQPQLLILASTTRPIRKHLWTWQLRQCFPTLRDLDRLTVTVNCESSETLDPSISSI